MPSYNIGIRKIFEWGGGGGGAMHSCIRFGLWMIMFSSKGPTSRSITITTKLSGWS